MVVIKLGDDKMSDSQDTYLPTLATVNETVHTLPRDPSALQDGAATSCSLAVVSASPTATTTTASPSTPSPQAPISTAATKLYVTLKILQLVKGFRKRIQTRVRAARSSKQVAARKIVDDELCQDFQRQALDQVSRCLVHTTRANGANHSSPSSKRRRLTDSLGASCERSVVSSINLATKQHPRGDARSLEELLAPLDDTLKQETYSLQAIAQNDSLFLARHNEFKLNLDDASVADVVGLLVTTDQLRSQVDERLQQAQTRVQRGKGSSQANDHSNDHSNDSDSGYCWYDTATLPPDDPPTLLANLLHLLLCLQGNLLAGLIAKLTRLVRWHLLDCQREADQRRRRQQREWFFEFPDGRPPLSTTWPWSIKPSLAVLWGVCWMFYAPPFYSRHHSLGDGDARRGGFGGLAPLPVTTASTTTTSSTLLDTSLSLPPALLPADSPVSDPHGNLLDPYGNVIATNEEFLRLFNEFQAASASVPAPLSGDQPPPCGQPALRRPNPLAERVFTQGRSLGQQHQRQGPWTFQIDHRPSTQTALAAAEASPQRVNPPSNVHPRRVNGPIRGHQYSSYRQPGGTPRITMAGSHPPPGPGAHHHGQQQQHHQAASPMAASPPGQSHVPSQASSPLSHGNSDQSVDRNTARHQPNSNPSSSINPRNHARNGASQAAIFAVGAGSTTPSAQFVAAVAQPRSYVGTSQAAPGHSRVWPSPQENSLPHTLPKAAQFNQRRDAQLSAQRQQYQGPRCFQDAQIPRLSPPQQGDATTQQAYCWLPPPDQRQHQQDLPQSVCNNPGTPVISVTDASPDHSGLGFYNSLPSPQANLGPANPFEPNSSPIFLPGPYAQPDPYHQYPSPGFQRDMSPGQEGASPGRPVDHDPADQLPGLRKRDFDEMAGHTPHNGMPPDQSNAPMDENGSLNDDDRPPPKAKTLKRGPPPMNAAGKYFCDFSEECASFIFDRKCEWSKHMDKHDRPYRCPHPDCAKLQGFTYSGGLLRHEREVHGKHGGPKGQLFCPFTNCKRSNGKGFTRKENLNEHIRRVHDNRTADDSNGGQVANAPTPLHVKRDVHSGGAEFLSPDSTDTPMSRISEALTSASSAAAAAAAAAQAQADGSDGAISPALKRQLPEHLPYHLQPHQQQQHQQTADPNHDPQLEASTAPTSAPLTSAGGAGGLELGTGVDDIRQELLRLRAQLADRDSTIAHMRQQLDESDQRRAVEVAEAHEARQRLLEQQQAQARGALQDGQALEQS